MADFNKVGLLVMNEEETKFLVCQKNKTRDTQQYILPGGKIEEEELELSCLVREVKEELDCKIDLTSLDYIDEYIDIAAGTKDKYVSIKLYKGSLIGQPTPSNEIENLYRIGAEDLQNDIVSPIIKNKIIPDLIKKSLLKIPV